MRVIIEDKQLCMLIEQDNQLGKQKFPSEIIKQFQKRILQIVQARDTQDLRAIKSLHFEKLKQHKYEGKYSIRINRSYRIIFRIDIEEKTVEILVIEEINNHYS
ncbi:type II toxin-antitoxin system RelE/ParE family toxin [Pedobacter metabolipauper]|uniref:Proteic killer suppression protein n=1 Tax=Pedobacter metabolipauper TaxID=425513 RepID=A0A4R6SU47_9SPHI|nr:type II toxin-antitoxin system RelE/ParE family toxin [Pedobacter metabolipauper]TDQ08538.1 proteic killer suppression protein [Pedobacter metabolipauper]